MIKNVVFSIAVMLGASATTGCSILPYDNDFGCKLKNNYGKCISSLDTYDEAVTGNDKGNAIGDEGVVEGKSQEASANSKASHSDPAYDNYRARVYQQLSSMIDQPETPMVKQAKVIRTLILGYSPSSDKRIAYMPRYVYSMLDEPSFVLTDYKLRSVDDQQFLLQQGSK